MTYTTYCSSPVGTLKITTDEHQILGVDFINDTIPPTNRIESTIAEKCIEQLEEYFNYQRQDFTLPLSPQGTNFQKLAWSELQRIPYGQTISYGEQAQKMSKMKAIRAVGSANSKNPIAIIIPCHRVIGKNGKLTGYAGELWRKEWLLKHETQLRVES